MVIAVGAIAPDFELQSSELEGDKPGKKIKLSNYRGKANVVLAFYPLDFSPVCTKEHECFYEDIGSFDTAGAQILGISVDSAWTHAAYAKKLGITYPLLSDFHPKGEVAKKYGLYFEEAGITKRATVIVDKAGKVTYVKEQPILEGRHNSDIVAELKKLG
jgi:peroxiredoxin